MIKAWNKYYETVMKPSIEFGRMHWKGLTGLSVTFIAILSVAFLFGYFSGPIFIFFDNIGEKFSKKEAA